MTIHRWYRPLPSTLRTVVWWLAFVSCVQAQIQSYDLHQQLVMEDQRYRNVAVIGTFVVYNFMNHPLLLKLAISSAS